LARVLGAKVNGRGSSPFGSTPIGTSGASVIKIGVSVSSALWLRQGSFVAACFLLAVVLPLPFEGMEGLQGYRKREDRLQDKVEGLAEIKVRLKFLPGFQPL
jgi:hypothetical protein